MTTTRNGGRDVRPVRRQQITPSPTFTTLHGTCPSPELVVFVAACRSRRDEAAKRRPPYRDRTGLAGRDPLVWELSHEPSTFGMDAAGVRAEAGRCLHHGWLEWELYVRFDIEAAA
jgi:hypothetical protein